MVDIFALIEREKETCVRCSMGVFYLRYPYAACMGHIYSPEGKSEFRISGFCEWCFDEVCDVEFIHGKNREDN
jgi:hypothetical protein